MQKLNVRFNPQVSNELKELVELLGFDESKIARAAMDFGISEIVKHYHEDGRKKTVALIGVHGLRQMLIKK